MAEHSFQEVMRQLNRLCLRYQYCSDCPMFDECGNVGAHCSDPKHSYRIEKTVMSWAAENPEPVYPSWGDYVTIKMLEDITYRNDTTPQTLGDWMRKTHGKTDKTRQGMY